MGAQALLVGGSRGVAGWFGGKIEEGKVVLLIWNGGDPEEEDLVESGGGQEDGWDKVARF